MRFGSFCIILASVLAGGCQGEASTDRPAVADRVVQSTTLSPMSTVTAFDFLNDASRAYWHNNDGQVPWNTGFGDDRGSCMMVSATLEDGSSAQGLFAHPKWVATGFMHGAFQVTIPEASKAPRLSATFGFLQGAQESDGVTFSITTLYEGHWYTLLQARKRYQGALQTSSADLSTWAGKTLTLFLNTDAGPTPYYDWALWKEAKIVVRNQRPYGYVDAVDMTAHSVNGWAKDDDSPSQAVDVHFYIDGVFRGQTEANSYRPDLGGNYGFAWSIPPALRNGEHELKAFAIDPQGDENPQLGYSPSKYNYQTGIVLGPITKAYNDAQMPFFMDGTMATMKVEGDPHRLYFFHTAGGETFKYKGTLDKPFEELIWKKTQEQYVDKRGLLEGYGCVRVWTESIYRHSSSLWLSFNHIEKFPASCGAYDGTEQYSIGLTVSKDQGESWQLCGEIIRPQMNTSNAGNVGGTPVLEVGGYFYVYFNEHAASGENRHSVARALVSDVVNAAASYTVVPWKKYDGGAWAEDGLGGLGAQVNTSDAHTDAAYCTHNQQYLLLAPSASGTLALQHSSDGIQWSQLAMIDDRTESDIWTVYGTFASTSTEASADNLQVGSSFHLIWPRKSGSDYGVDDLYTRRVSFTK